MRRAAVAVALHAGVIVVSTASLSGCETPPPPQYGWGSYEEMIYTSMARPGELGPEAQLRRLADEAAEIEAAGSRVPPGWYAHMASLNNQIGQFDRARELLALEKFAYPESARFVDTLIKNLDGKKGAK